MKDVILHVHSDKLNEQISNIKRGCDYLQKIHDGLKALGAETITIDDLKTLMLADGRLEDIKRIVLRDKVLQVAGMTIARETIFFDKRALADLSRICRQTPNSLEQGDFYEIVDGKVKPIDSLGSDLMPRHKLYGSQRQKDIADKMAAIAVQINALRTEIGHDHAHAPMRLPESWFRWDNSGEYVVDKYRVSQHITP